MHKSKQHLREPLIYITKRDNVPLKTSILIRAAAIVLALAVCAVVSKVLTGDNPLSLFATVLHGAFGKGRTLVTIHDIAILLCISLAVTPAFRMRFWNTGAEGQTLMGCLATAYCMFTFGGKVPDWTLILIMITAAVLAGIVWGIIPAFCKAQWGTNETLFTLMMNYVAIQLIEYFLNRLQRRRPRPAVARLVPGSLRRRLSAEHRCRRAADHRYVHLPALQQARV